MRFNNIVTFLQTIANKKRLESLTSLTFDQQKSADYFFNKSNNTSAASSDEAGFCPVINRPSFLT